MSNASQIVRGLRFLLPVVSLAFAPIASGCKSMSSHSASADPAATPGSASGGVIAASSGENAHPETVGTSPGHAGKGTALKASGDDRLAIFAAGCFWGVESTFRAVPGVVATAVGYTGGHTKDPTYTQVCTHTTGHAEAVLIEFDPKKVSYEKLLDVFFENHDPTTVDSQGPDFGDQYRSAIFTLDAEQEGAAKTAVARHQKKLATKIATQIGPAQPFYLAEDYHQQYHEKTGTHACPTGKATAEGI